MPKILDKAVQKVKAQSPGVNPYAVATASLQRSGSLKPGTQQATPQGVARGRMTASQRQATPPAETPPVRPIAKPKAPKTSGVAMDLAAMAKK
ncbi:MAG TPA: hypothetical protein VGF39_09535 [Stellaceae bacterium]|jgi:hypothetical protein